MANCFDSDEEVFVHNPDEEICHEMQLYKKGKEKKV